MNDGAIIHGNADLYSETGDTPRIVSREHPDADTVMDSAPELRLAQQAYGARLRSIPRPCAPEPLE